MVNRVLVFLICCITVLSGFADPGCKLGQSLSSVKSEVPDLRHLRNWPTQGDQYVIYHDTKASTSYYFKNDRVVKEVFTYRGNQQTANYYFDSFVSDFMNQNYLNIYRTSDSVTFYFSQIKVTVSVEYFTGYEYLCKVTYTNK